MIHGRARKACGPYSCGSHRENRKHTLTIQNTFHIASRLAGTRVMKAVKPTSTRIRPTPFNTSIHVMVVLLHATRSVRFIHVAKAMPAPTNKP